MSTRQDSAAIPFANVLYYPHIEFVDETWVKSALCVWEHVYRIVPSSYRPHDSDEIKQAIDADAVRDITLTARDLGTTATAFEEFVEDVPFIPAGADRRREISLHADKIDQRIVPLLESLGKKVSPQGWIELPDRYANAYMLFLAETVSRHRQIPKLTDSSDMFAVMHYFMADGNVDEGVSSPEAAEISATLALETVLPGGIAGTSMERILSFRAKFAEGRSAFRNTVAKVIERLAALEDSQYRDEVIADFNKRLKHAQTSIIDELRGLGSEIVTAILCAGFPAGTAALFGVDNPFTKKALGSAGVVFGVTALADAVRARRARWRPEESLYHLNLRETFGEGKRLQLRVPDYGYLINEYVND